MNTIIRILLLCSLSLPAAAQRITHDFHDVSLSEALKYVNDASSDYQVSFI